MLLSRGHAAVDIPWVKFIIACQIGQAAVEVLAFSKSINPGDIATGSVAIAGVSILWFFTTVRLVVVTIIAP